MSAYRASTDEPRKHRADRTHQDSEFERVVRRDVHVGARGANATYREARIVKRWSHVAFGRAREKEFRLNRGVRFYTEDRAHDGLRHWIAVLRRISEQLNPGGTFHEFGF